MEISGAHLLFSLASGIPDLILLGEMIAKPVVIGATVVLAAIYVTARAEMGSQHSQPTA